MTKKPPGRPSSYTEDMGVADGSEANIRRSALAIALQEFDAQDLIVENCVAVWDGPLGFAIHVAPDRLEEFAKRLRDCADYLDSPEARNGQAI